MTSQMQFDQSLKAIPRQKTSLASLLFLGSPSAPVETTVGESQLNPDDHTSAAAVRQLSDRIMLSSIPEEQKQKSLSSDRDIVAAAGDGEEDEVDLPVISPQKLEELLANSLLQLRDTGSRSGEGASKRNK